MNIQCLRPRDDLHVSFAVPVPALRPCDAINGGRRSGLEHLKQRCDVIAYYFTCFPKQLLIVLVLSGPPW